MKQCKVCGNTELDAAGRCVWCQTQVVKVSEPLKLK